MPAPNRRSFIKAAGLAAAGLAARSLSATHHEKHGGAAPATPEVHLFSKHLQFLDYPEMAAAAKKMGFAGLDLSVRPGGHVEPKNVATDLPKAVQAIKNEGLSFRMMTTAITKLSDLHAREVLETASSLGCQIYRMGYLKYDESLNWRENLERHKTGLSDLAAFNRSLDLHGAYQNHAGQNVGSYLPDLAYLFEGLDPQYSGVQYDIRHAVVEGGNAWPLGLKLVQDKIRSIVIKDFTWETAPGKLALHNTPLSEGCVDFAGYFKFLKQYDIKPLVSLHTEYDLGGANRGKREITIPAAKVFQAMKRDLNSFNSLWTRSYR